MHFDILSLFPAMFRGPLDESLMRKALAKGLFTFNLVDLRAFAADKHKTADDSPYGGGAGMVMKVDVIEKALKSLPNSSPQPRTILLCPAGARLTHSRAKELANESRLILLCGHYEGFDERIKSLVDEEISIGDYVLTGGELPAMVLLDAVVRQIPMVVKEESSIENDSFYSGLLDFPCYTRPQDFDGKRVPEILLSGSHGAIAAWRRKEALRKTLFYRPDLLARAELSKEDREYMKEIFLDG